MSDPFIHNRDFFVRMRSAAYVRAHEHFHKAAALSPAEGFPDREFLRAVESMLLELEAALEYAVDAVRGLKRMRVQRFRHDRSYGVLEEEIVLRHLLEEMTALTGFLRMRVETDLKIRRYRDRIRRLKIQRSGGLTPAPGVLDSLGELIREEVGDLRRILDLMESRFKVGDRLLEVLRNKKPASSLETDPVLN
jgi:hypothetical protein